MQKELPPHQQASLLRPLAPRLLPAPGAKWLPIIWLTLSFIGLIDAAFLTFKHFAGGVLPCAVWGGCGAVTQSAYSMVFGIPISSIGAGYYLVIFILGVIYFERRLLWAKQTAALLTLGGLIVSVTLVNLQLFVIKAICFYCMISAVTTILLFFLFLPTLKRLA